MFSVGDEVTYEGVTYIIEKDYGNGVFFIGNNNAFVDCVPAHLLTKKF